MQGHLFFILQAIHTDLSLIHILERAQAIGIPKENVYIDCLTLTASAEQEGVMETLNAVYRVKHELGLKTVLGVSNISFGLPNRVLVNHIFLRCV